MPYDSRFLEDVFLVVMLTLCLFLFSFIYVFPLSIIHEVGHVLGGLIVGGDVRGIVFTWDPGAPAYTDMTISVNPLNYFIVYFSGGAFASMVFYIHYRVTRRFSTGGQVRFVVVFFARLLFLFLAIVSGFNCMFEAVLQGKEMLVPGLADLWSLAAALISAVYVVFFDPVLIRLRQKKLDQANGSNLVNS